MRRVRVRTQCLLDNLSWMVENFVALDRVASFNLLPLLDIEYYLSACILASPPLQVSNNIYGLEGRRDALISAAASARNSKSRRIRRIRRRSAQILPLVVPEQLAVTDS